MQKAAKKKMVRLKTRKSRKYHENDFHGPTKQSVLLIKTMSFMCNLNIYSVYM